MTEPHGEPLTVETALQTLKGLEGFEPGLYRRTEGITWMIWGLVTAGIYFTFGTAGATTDGSAMWFRFLWLPWILAGMTATFALWRSIHLAAGLRVGRNAGRRYGIVVFLAYFLLFGAGFQIYQAVGASWNLKEPGYVLALLAVGSSVISFVRPGSTAARTMILIVAGLALASALALGAVHYPSVSTAYLVQTYASALVLGGGWFLGGLALTLKG